MVKRKSTKMKCPSMKWNKITTINKWNKPKAVTKKKSNYTKVDLSAVKNEMSGPKIHQLIGTESF